MRLLRSLESSKQLIKNSELYHSIKFYKTEILLYMMASARNKAVIRMLSNYHTRLKRLKTHITGKDLKNLGVPPGPMFSKILGLVLNARLDNLVETKNDEINFVKTIIHSDLDDIDLAVNKTV